MATTTPTPTASATTVGRPSWTNNFARRSPSVAPENAPDRDADQRKTNLDGRQIPTGIACECEGAARANDVAIDQGLQPSAPGGHDSEFRKRQEAVYED